MRRYYLAALVSAAVVALVAYFASSTAKSLNFKSHLTGGNVYPAVGTSAHADAVFQLSVSGNELSYSLTVTNIENITDAHIHAGSSGDSLGQLLVNLYDGDVRPGLNDGILARGTITPSDFRGPLIDQPMSALIAIFADGLAYVDIHTEQNPIGEVRGQITQ